ncbi:MAG: AEC family transporter [Arcicella sp.]|nr:AEC family transporter [Arcicella sp.]
MNQTNNVFIITLSIIFLGFLLKKYNFITEKEGKTISKFLMYTTFPALMIITTATVKLDTSLLLIPIFAVILGSSMLLVAWIWFSDYEKCLRGVLTMGVGGFNSGLFGFPIIEGLFGKQAMVYAIMFDIGNTIIVFGAIYSIGSYFSVNKKEQTGIKPIFKKVMSLPPVLGILFGLLINVTNIKLPTIFFDFLEVLAIGNKPLVLLLMGIYLSFDLDKKLMLAISKVLIIRISIGILAVVGLYLLLHNSNSSMKNVLIICSLLPVGLTILPFSDELGYDSRIAGTLLNISLLVSFVLMWGLVLVL